MQQHEKGTQLDLAMGKLQEVVEDGLRHGFCRFTVSCELIRDRKRAVTIDAGKLYRFVIPEEDLKP